MWFGVEYTITRYETPISVLASIGVGTQLQVYQVVCRQLLPRCNDYLVSLKKYIDGLYNFHLPAPCKRCAPPHSRASGQASPDAT